MIRQMSGADKVASKGGGRKVCYFFFWSDTKFLNRNQNVISNLTHLILDRCQGSKHLDPNPLQLGYIPATTSLLHMPINSPLTYLMPINVHSEMFYNNPLICCHQNPSQGECANSTRIAPKRPGSNPGAPRLLHNHATILLISIPFIP